LYGALDWEGVIKKAQRALDEYYIGGVTTNLSLHRDILADEHFKKGEFDTSFLDERVEKFALLHTIGESEDRSISSFTAKLMQKGLLSFKGEFI
jgi:pyruvate carboxylase subunit A